MSKIDPVDKVYVSGFPYPEMRPGQGPAIAGILRSLVENGKKFVVMRAPTGSGKSPIAVGVAQAMHSILDKTMHLDTGGQFERGWGVHATATTDKEEELRARTLPWYQFFNSQKPPYAPTHHSRFLFATPRKALQDQYIKDYGDREGFTVLKGKSNYNCGYDPDVTADECGIWDKANKNDPERPQHCFSCHTCPYKQSAERALVTHPYVITNYHSLQSWLWMKWEGILGADVRYAMLIVDEAHFLPEFLTDFASTKINTDTLESDVHDMLDEYEYPSGVYPVEGMAQDKQDVVSWENYWTVLAHVMKRIEDGEELDTRDLAVLMPLIGICRHLHVEFKQGDNKDKAYEYSKKERVLDEVLHGYLKVLSGDLSHDEFQYFLNVDAESEKPLLGLHCKSPKEGFRKLAKNFQHVVMMSGTISIDAFCDDLGIPEEDVYKHDMAITIPHHYRPFIVLGDKTTNMAYKNRDTALPLIAQNIVKLAHLHKDWRGIIHTQSAKNAWALYDQLKRLLPGEKRRGSERIGRFIFHYKGSKFRAMRDFMADLNDNSVLISPSIAEGFDGKDKVARWQCIMKIPYLPRKDGAVMARLKESDGELWYTLESLTTLTQMYGRVNRHPTDYGITYMLDGGWSGFTWRVRQQNAWPHTSPVFQEGVATSKDFVYFVKPDGKLSPAAVLRGHPALDNAQRVLTPKQMMEYLDDH